MDKVGLTFEELDEQDLMAIHGGVATPTPTTLTLASSGICLAGSFVVSASISIVSVVFIKK